MKFKGLTKLALSGVALAAVAATLGTSTYAWYVTNSEATVTGVKGTAQAGGLGNVLVAQASDASGSVNGHGKFAQTQALSNANIDQTNKTAGLLPTTPCKTLTKVAANPNAEPPVAASLSSTPATLLNSSTIWADAEGNSFETTDGKAYIDFDVWVLSTDATKVQFNFAIENTTASSDVTKQIAYAATGLPSTVDQGDTFAVNFVEALRLGYTQYTYTSEQAASASAVTGTEASASVIFDNSVATSSSAVEEGTDFVSHTNMTGASANGYYDAVLGAETPIITTGPTVNGTATQQITVTKGVETRLHFYIWLEGTDEACFDSCSGQSFNVVLSFTAVKEA